MTAEADSATIRNIRADDERDVVDLWNICLPRDEIALDTFRRRVLLDTNFDAEGCFVARTRSRLVGFLLSIRRRYPYYDLGLEPDRGWITAFFVHPGWQRRKIASRLLHSAEEFLVSHGVRTISISDYTPNYFIPGVDLDAYGSAVQFLNLHGYQKTQSVYGMGRSLLDIEVPPLLRERFAALRKSGIEVCTFRPSYTLEVLNFLRRHYPGDLFRLAHDRLVEDPECDDILLAVNEGDVIGFSHFKEERFGPFGIAPAYAGRGIGPMLYFATVEQMRKKGKQNLWLAWTTGRAKDFYYKMGLRVTRRHAIMKKTLQEAPRP